MPAARPQRAGLGAVAAETTQTLIPLGEHTLRGIAAPCAVFGTHH